MAGASAEARAPGVSTLFFSLEMSTQALVLRMLCALAKVPASRLMAGEIGGPGLHGDLMLAAAQLQKVPFHLDDTGGLTAQELCERARKLKTEDAGMTFVVVDYLQLVRSGRPDGPGQDGERIAHALKALALDLGITVLLTSQLSRRDDPSMPPSARPELLENHADVVCVLRRSTGKEGESVLVDVLKNQHGPTACGVPLPMDEWPGGD
jgi:replicative DNA helicase